jgi:hypothetical protein
MADQESTSQTPGKTKPEWTPHIWLGCTLTGWMRLLCRNRWAIHPIYWYVALIVTFATLVHVLMQLLQRAWFGDRIDRTPIQQAPLFIIGHWRTGTTLLHELLIQDERHNYPNNYQCLVPEHFLISEWLFPRLFWFLLPPHRPMDNMAMGWTTPQEDEFALCMLGQPSPYLTIAFPNHPPQDQEAFDLERLKPRQRQRWKEAFLRFLRHLTYRDPRRLVLKSPTHSCRIKVLLELFPDARFVHIVRDPYVVFPSTIKLWKALYETQGMQLPKFAGLEEHVFQTFVYLYDRIEQDRKLVPAGQFHELRYEDLVRDPIGELHRMYQALGLVGFEEALPKFQSYLAENAGYQTNRYRPLDPALQAEITGRWGKVVRHYGYGRDVDEERNRASA